jgi:hypothetical protein
LLLYNPSSKTRTRDIGVRGVTSVIQFSLLKEILDMNSSGSDHDFPGGKCLNKFSALSGLGARALTVQACEIILLRPSYWCC